MSYTSKVRRMLCEIELKKRCCAESELSFLLYLLAVTPDNPDVQSDEKDFIRRIAFLCKKSTGIRPPVTLRREKDGKVRYITDAGKWSVFDNDTCLEKLLLANHADECCKRALLRSCLAAAGTVSSPERSSAYIELYFKKESDADFIKSLLSRLEIRCGKVKRRERFVVYIKNFEGICDFLILTGAQTAMLEFQVAKADREVSNNVNRAMNCDMANISRSSCRGLKEAELIDNAKKNGRYASLPEQLTELAELRLANPDASLSDLGNLLNPPLSKSGVSHRMKKITEHLKQP